MTDANPQEIDHPSPHRERTSLFSLLYGLIAAPVGWIAAQLVNATLAQEACFPGTRPLGDPTFGNVHGLAAIALAASMLVSASAAFLAHRAWRRTCGEQNGDTHALIAIGEGRSRFMALAGLLTSIAFLIGAMFSIPALAFVPSC
jgi:hypothetical protein